VDQVLISLGGYTFLVVRLPDGSIAVILRHLCEALHLSRLAQTRRIERHPFLAKHLLLVRIQTPGGPQDVNALLVSVLSLWLGGFDLTRLSEEKRELIMLLQEDAEEAFSRPFVVTPLEPPQPPKAPPPLPQQERAALSVYDLLRAAARNIVAAVNTIEVAANRMEQDNQEVRQRLSSVEQEQGRAGQQVENIERQQMVQVAWMAEKGHELEVQGRWMQTLTLRVDHLSEQPQPPEEAGVPLPSVERLHALQTMPYEQYVHTPEWKAQREAAIKRALDRCQLCNSTQTLLFAHHRTYERRGQERPEDIFVLCVSCHARHHAHASAERRRKRAGGAGASGSEHSASPEYEL
jgi:hypothetical protein